MNRWQKIAWFNLIVVIGGSVISLVAAGTLPPDERLMPPNRITVVIIITLVLIGMSKTIFRKSDMQMDLDERDKQIHHKANLYGWTAFGLGMAATIWICYIAVGPLGSFPPLALPIIILVGLAFKIMAESIAALILYGREIKGEQL